MTTFKKSMTATLAALTPVPKGQRSLRIPVNKERRSRLLGHVTC